jgi:hypothetical protein
MKIPLLDSSFSIESYPTLQVADKLGGKQLMNLMTLKIMATHS